MLLGATNAALRSSPLQARQACPDGLVAPRDPERDRVCEWRSQAGSQSEDQRVEAEDRPAGAADLVLSGGHRLDGCLHELDVELGGDPR